MTGRREAGAGALEKILGYTFTRAGLLCRALTHASAAGKPEAAERSYETLEFLGDRVLGLVVAELLFRRYANENEGARASRHASLVSGKALARVARDIGLSNHLILAPGEDDSGGRRNPALLANACEAVIAALYLDGGLAAASEFISRHWTALMEAQAEPPKDPKTALQEWTQAETMGLPVYREVERTGPPHAPVFEVAARVGRLAPAMGRGATKRVAEQAAAAALLQRLTRRRKKSA